MKNSIFWGTQLAFVDHGKVQLSIIYIPKLNEIYYGIRGKGVYLNHKKVNIKRNVSFQESAIEFCGSCHKKYEEKKELFERLLSNSTRPANFMHINSCCFAFSNLLSGRSNTLIISTRKPWEVVPGMFMVEELGIKSYDYEGIRIYSNTKDIDKFL